MKHSPLRLAKNNSKINLSSNLLVQSQSQTQTQSKKRIAKILGQSILLASIQASIGSVEMSSKFSVVNFSTDQRTLQAAADALTGYLIIGFVWMIGAMMISFGQYELTGLISSFIANVIMIGWIFLSYLHSFRSAIRRHSHLKFPKLFRFSYS